MHVTPIHKVFACALYGVPYYDGAPITTASRITMESRTAAGLRQPSAARVAAAEGPVASAMPRKANAAQNARGPNLADALAQAMWRGSTEVTMRTLYETGRHYAFETERASISLAVLPKDGFVVLVGWIEPVLEVEIRVLNPAGIEVATGSVDERGRFRIPCASGGPIRLELANKPLVATEWFSID